CAVPWLSVGTDRHVDALLAGGAGHRTADLVGSPEPARSQPGDAAGHVHASRDALRLLIRLAQYASPSPASYVRAAGPVLRGVAADGLPSWGGVGRSPAERCCARRHGGRAAAPNARGDP